MGVRFEEGLSWLSTTTGSMSVSVLWFCCKCAILAGGIDARASHRGWPKRHVYGRTRTQSKRFGVTKSREQTAKDLRGKMVLVWGAIARMAQQPVATNTS